MTTLNDRRRAKGFKTVAKFAETCGLPVSKMTKIVNGENVHLTNEDIIAIARVLDMRFQEVENALREKPPTREQMKKMQEEIERLKGQERLLRSEIAVEKYLHQVHVEDYNRLVEALCDIFHLEVSSQNSDRNDTLLWDVYDTRTKAKLVSLEPDIGRAYGFAIQKQNQRDNV